MACHVMKHFVNIQILSLTILTLKYYHVHQKCQIHIFQYQISASEPQTQTSLLFPPNFTHNIFVLT